MVFIPVPNGIKYGRLDVEIQNHEKRHRRLIREIWVLTVLKIYEFSKWRIIQTIDRQYQKRDIRKQLV